MTAFVQVRFTFEHSIIEWARSVEKHPFHPCMKESDYEEVMEKLKRITDCFADEYEGNFYLLLGNVNKMTFEMNIK